MTQNDPGPEELDRWLRASTSEKSGTPSQGNSLGTSSSEQTEPSTQTKAPHSDDEGKFFMVERRIENVQEVVLVVAKNRDLANDAYAALIDQAVTERTYIVRIFRADVPDPADPVNPEKAVARAGELVGDNYSDAEQIAAFVRLWNVVMVDMNVTAAPHMAMQLPDIRD